MLRSLQKLFSPRADKDAVLRSLVNDLLDLAVRQRSVLSLRFGRAEASTRRLSGPCGGFDQSVVLVDVDLPKDFGWAGEIVDVEFLVKEQRDTVSLYRFTSQIRGATSRKNGFGLLLDRPSEIVSGQKRQFVRLSATPEMILGLDIWMPPPASSMPAQEQALGSPLFSRRRDLLLNLSAGGMRLKLSGGEIALAVGDPLVCHLRLCPVKNKSSANSVPRRVGEDPEDRDHAFWLSCSVKNMQGEARDLCLGLNFTAWAEPRTDGKDLHWLASGEGGSVGPLLTWVMRWQLMRSG